MQTEMNDVLLSVMISASPLGEARAGIPFALIHGLHPYTAFTSGLLGNILVFPIMMFFLENLNKRLFSYRPYKRMSVKVARKARNKTGSLVKKHGFLGLMFFVMIPLPVTGAYIGTMGAYIFGIKKKQAFLAVAAGLIVSCLIVTLGVHLSIGGVEVF